MDGSRSKHTYPKVNVGKSIEHVALGVASRKDLADWLVLFCCDNSVGDVLGLSVIRDLVRK